MSPNPSEPLKRDRFVEEVLSITTQEANQAVSHLLPGGSVAQTAVQTAIGSIAQMTGQGTTGMTPPFQSAQSSGLSGATPGFAGPILAESTQGLPGATPGFAGPIAQGAAQIGGQAVQRAANNFTRFADVIVQAVPANLRPYAQTAVPAILQAAAQQNANLPQTAYMLATAQHESDFGSPHTWHGIEYPALEEVPWHLAQSQTPQDYFDSRYNMPRHADLGNQAGTSDGYDFRGRGYVQVTGRNNYQDWTNRLQPDNAAINLVAHPEQATNPQTAARILAQGMMQGTFTGRALPDYVNDTATDFANARRVVNGTDRAATFAATAQIYQSTLQNAVQSENVSDTQPPYR